MATDEPLVLEAKSAPEGDTRAFEELVRRHQQQVLANCRYLTRSPTDAQDLAQEVFIKAFFSLDGLVDGAAFGGWLKRIKVNHCLSFLRKRRGRSFVDVDDPMAETEPELAQKPRAHRNAESADQRERIRATLDEIPDTLRVPLIMRDLDGMSYQEIADALGIGLSAVKMRIKRGREVFRELFNEREPEETPA